MGYDYGYDYGYGYGSNVGSVLSGLLIFVLIVGCVSLVFAVLMIIGQWKCFKKAGYKGWEVLIAGHNQFVNCTFAGVNPILVLAWMFGSIVTIIPVIGWLAYLGFLVYYQAVVGVNTAKAFGKGIGFGVALAIPFSAPIAWFILGKEDVKYVGVNTNKKAEQNVQTNYQQPMNNGQQVNPATQQFVNNGPVMPVQPVQPVSNNENVMPTQPVTPQPVQNSNCSRCGAPVNPGDRFCMSCGNQL